ncbi:MAG: hypothetical protein ACKVS6_07020 [Planctomycetota bacterium]
MAPSNHSPKRTRAVRRILTILGGFAAAVVLLELILQAAAYYQSFEVARRFQNENPKGLPVVAFVGDSNIYGLYVSKDETVAAAVERLSARDGQKQIHCVNFGRPSAPSWEVLNQLRRAAELKPAAIVARCGINNYSSVPTDTNTGFIEKSRLVKLFRILEFNWRYWNANKLSLAQGAGGELVEDAVMQNASGDTKVYLTKSRDGDAVPFEVIRREGQIRSEEMRPRFRADLTTMADLAAEKNIKLIFAGYLAGLDGGFQEIREITKYMDGYKNAQYVDCATIVTQALGIGKNAKPADWSMERVHAVRSLILTNDRHPTAFGYEVEARAIGKALKDLGLLKNAEIDDPVEYLKKGKITIPSLEVDITKQESARQLAYLYHGEPNDRIALIFGVAGSSYINEIEIPFNTDPIVQIIGIDAARSMTATAGADGRARIEVNPAIVSLLKDARFAACLVQRGGIGGAARMLLSKVLDYRP